MEIVVAGVQMAMADRVETNLDLAERLVRQAARDGADLVVLPELFEGRYFCIDQTPDALMLARPLEGHPTVERFAALAGELGVVIPISLYELAGPTRFNTVVLADADGSILGSYRKSHLPDGPGYTEKYYFSPGDTGFRVWDTRIGRIGVGICWDQWFPEAARIMALAGAQIIVYPSAIGSEPPDPDWDSSAHWTRVMQGHAAANLVPVVAVNRTGTEPGRHHDLTFYGSSFITDATGALVSVASRDRTEVIRARMDLDAGIRMQASWGLFRDRRPDLYRRLGSLDGQGSMEGC
jgi:N-carbamoylputrescine amidase